MIAISIAMVINMGHEQQYCCGCTVRLHIRNVVRTITHPAIVLLHQLWEDYVYVLTKRCMIQIGILMDISERP
jgi:hypothetical protein